MPELSIDGVNWSPDKYLTLDEMEEYGEWLIEFVKNTKVIRQCRSD